MTTPRKILDRHILEKDFQRQVVDLARLKGWKVYHTFDSRKSEPGFPDLFMVHEDQRRALALEVKRQGAKTTEAQDAWLKALRAGGIPAFVIRPSDWDDLVLLLSKQERPE